MSTIVVFYSYTGSTRKYAEKFSNADIYEIKDVKRPGKFKAYTKGGHSSLTHGTFPVEPIEIDYGKYDKIIICSPVWAGNTTPQINNLFDILPKDKEIDLHMISISGMSNKEKTIQWIGTKGYKISNYTDIKKGDLS